MTTRLGAVLLISSLAVAAGGCDLLGGNSMPPQELEPLKAEDHDRFFPIVGGNHDGVACIECHAPEQQSFKEFSCVGCHEHEQELMDTTHNGFEDYLYNSVSCYACHPRGDIGEEIPHLEFPIRVPSPHADVSCAECHTDPNNREVIGCIGCHEHTVAPMGRVHNGMPDYQWQSNRCLFCHEGGINPGLLEHTFFPTAAETVHEEVSCAECHAKQEAREQLACITCHEHEQEPMDEAHGAINEYLWESASCFLCHPQAQVPGELLHDFFPIQPPAAHEGIGCIDCHADEENRSSTTCITCHDHEQTATDMIHAGIPDYAYDSPSCLFCHPGSEPTGLINHGDYFPIDPPAAHEEITCRECHLDPADRDAVGCISCHEHEQQPMATVHQDIDGYAWDSPSCLGCHPNAEPVGLVDHDFFPIAAPSQHSEVSCNECHIDDNDRSVVGCTSCHEHSVEPMAAVHTAMPDYAWDSVTCLTCHPSGIAPGLLDHSAFFPITNTDVHDEQTCLDCHASQTNRSELSCASCHEHEQAPMAAAHDGIPGYTWSSNACFLCHRTAQVPGEIDHESFFPIDPPAAHEGIDCVDCHTNPNDQSVVGCTSCHEHEQAATDTIHAAVGGYAYNDASCLLCHPNAEPVGVVDHTDLFPITAPAPHSEVGCTECHIDPNDQQVLGCATCHEAADVDPVHEGIAGYLHSSPACLGCHPMANKPGLLDHSPWFPIVPPQVHGDVTCVECHASRANRSDVLCAACHEATPTAQIHQGIPGYLHDSPACLTCHPNANPAGFDHTPFFPISPADAHGEVGCAECHLDENDQSVLGCAECHDQAETTGQHTAVPDYAHVSTACITCHPNGQALGLAGVDHAPIFPIGPDTDHGTVGCLACHVNTDDMSDNGCKQCHEQEINLSTTHQTAIKSGALAGLIDNSADCKLCHADSQVHPVSSHNPFRISSGAHRGLCVECHLDNRVDKPWALDFGPFECIECHEHRQSAMNDKHNEVNNYSWSSPACVDCHPDGRN
jgi:hypothetical protein